MTDKNDSPTDSFYPMAVDGPDILGVRETKDGEQSISSLRPLKEGQPIDPDMDLVEVSASPDKAYYTIRSLGHKGPARVSNDTYRNNYDKIFKKKRKLDPTLN